MMHSDFWPLIVLLLSVGMVIIMIARWHIHPFIALMLAAIFVGLISPSMPVPPGQHSLLTAVELPMAEFGAMAGKADLSRGRETGRDHRKTRRDRSQRAAVYRRKKAGASEKFRAHSR